MAMQIDIAYSSTSLGTAILSGGPYRCVIDEITPQVCLSQPQNINLTKSLQYALEHSGKTIDPLSNLSSHKIFIFAGTLDNILAPATTKLAEVFYRNFTSEANITSQYKINSAHALVTDDYGKLCPEVSENFLTNCNYDTA